MVEHAVSLADLWHLVQAETDTWHSLSDTVKTTLKSDKLDFRSLCALSNETEEVLDELANVRAARRTISFLREYASKLLSQSIQKDETTECIEPSITSDVTRSIAECLGNDDLTSQDKASILWKLYTESLDVNTLIDPPERLERLTAQSQTIFDTFMYREASLISSTPGLSTIIDRPLIQLILSCEDGWLDWRLCLQYTPELIKVLKHCWSLAEVLLQSQGTDDLEKLYATTKSLTHLKLLNKQELAPSNDINDTVRKTLEGINETATSLITTKVESWFYHVTNEIVAHLMEDYSLLKIHLSVLDSKSPHDVSNLTCLQKELPALLEQLSCHNELGLDESFINKLHENCANQFLDLLRRTRDEFAQHAQSIARLSRRDFSLDRFDRIWLSESDYLLKAFENAKASDAVLVNLRSYQGFLREQI